MPCEEKKKKHPKFFSPGANRVNEGDRECVMLRQYCREANQISPLARAWCLAMLTEMYFLEEAINLYLNTLCIHFRRGFTCIWNGVLHFVFMYTRLAMSDQGSGENRNPERILNYQTLSKYPRKHCQRWQKLTKRTDGLTKGGHRSDLGPIENSQILQTQGRRQKKT